MQKIVFGILLLSTLNQVCARPTEKQWPFTLQNGKLEMPKLSAQEISGFKRDLSTVRDGHIPYGATDTILFEGKVIKELSSDSNGQPAWLVQPEHFFLGKEKIHTNGVKLMSPTLSNNGLKLAVGKRYKFCAVGIDQTTNDKTGTLFVWDGLVLELNESRKK